MKNSTLAKMLFALLMILINMPANAQRIMVTYAGTGIAGFSGDGGAGKAAKISGPNDVCMDAAHNIYFVDEGNNRVRMAAAATGMITTIAGGGTSTADGVPATTASIFPHYMCIDAAGNLYISTSNQIKKIAAGTGIITTIAGISSAGFSGDGGLAIAASLGGPAGVCVDAAGNIYFVDQSNNRIREVTAATGIINTIGGSGMGGYTGDGGPALTAEIYDAYAIAVNAAGDVFFSDQDGNYVREISAATGMMMHIAGIPSGYVAAAAGGPAATTAIGQVYGMHCDGGGDIYCDDGSCSCVRIDMMSGNIYLEAGSLSVDGYNGDGRGALTEYLNVPGGLWVDAAGNIFIADNNNNRMRKAIQLTHTPTYAFGEGQYINACPGIPFAVDSQMTITDLDSAQTETWTVISAPMHGTLTGFPFSMASLGTNSVVMPNGTFYTSAAAYRGLDSFRVQVSDGALADVVTIYIASGAGAIAGPNRVCGAGTIMLTDGIEGGVWSASNSNAIVSPDGLVTGMSAGTDVIQYSLNNSCGVVNAASTVSVDMAPPATAGTISGPESVCAGVAVSMADLTGGGAWSVSNGSATVSTGGTFTGMLAGSDTVLYTVTNGCGAINAATVINVIPQPNAGTIMSESTVCMGSTMALTDAAGGGLWSASNAHSTITGAGLLTGVTAGADTIVYTVANSCGTATASERIIVNNCALTGVSTASSTPAINLFPNPASSTLNVEWTALQPGNATIIVTDVASREVLKTALNINAAGEMQVDVSGLKEGVYILTLNSGPAHFTDKFVVGK